MGPHVVVVADLLLALEAIEAGRAERAQPPEPARRDELPPALGARDGSRVVLVYRHNPLFRFGAPRRGADQATSLAARGEIPVTLEQPRIRAGVAQTLAAGPEEQWLSTSANRSRAGLVRTNGPRYGGQSGFWRHPRSLFESHRRH